MYLRTSVSSFILSEKRFCPFLNPRVRELHDIVSKKSSFLYAGCKEQHKQQRYSFKLDAACFGLQNFIFAFNKSTGEKSYHPKINSSPTLEFGIDPWHSLMCIQWKALPSSTPSILSAIFPREPHTSFFLNFSFMVTKSNSSVNSVAEYWYCKNQKNKKGVHISVIYKIKNIHSAETSITI